jgi:hypothetical protein
VRRTRWLALALIAPALAACGGDSEDTSSSTPKPPLTVPGESTVGTTDSTTTDSTETAPSGDTSSPSTTGPADQPNPGNGGVPAPDNNPPADQAPEDSPSNDTPPEPGSPADRFEQFCAQNPGAC